MSARWITVRNARPVEIKRPTAIRCSPSSSSVEPTRTTPEVAAAFTENVHPRMLGLTGTPEQTDAAARAYRVYYRINREGDDPYYLVDHSAFTYLVLPEHGFVEFFNRETSPQDMAERTECFLNAGS